MAESYILIAQASTGAGTRNLWQAEGGTAGTTLGLVDGVMRQVAVPAYNAFDFLPATAQAAGGAANATRLLASLDWLSEGATGFAASFLAAALADGRAFDAPAGPFNPTIAGDPNSFPQPGPYFGQGALSFLFADRDWNAVKNLEINIDSEDLAGLSRITVRNVVDVRVKLGSEDAPATEDGNSATDQFISLSLLNLKRGSLDATDSDKAVDLTLSFASNNAQGQTSFDARLSDHDDLLVLQAGDHAGATFQNFRLANDGRFSLLTADLGAGDDTLIVFSGRAATIIRGGADTGVLTIQTAASPLPGLIPDITTAGVARGDSMVAGAGQDTFRYFAGDGVDQIFDFNAAQDRIAISSALQSATSIQVIDGSSVILFDTPPAAGPGSTDFSAGIFVQGVVLTLADLVWIA
jgi:hypothetical protein